MSELTVYPDAHPESTSVDGYTRNAVATDTWAARREVAGAVSVDTSASNLNAGFNTSHVTDKFISFYRSIVLFDTSALGAGATISSAVCEFICISKNEGVGSQSISLTTSLPASNTGLVAADHITLGDDPTDSSSTSTIQAPNVTVDSLTADSSTFNRWTLNAAGLASISKTGITKFGLRNSADASGVEPDWTGDASCICAFATAEDSSPADLRPRLVIQYTAAFTPKVIMF